MNVAILYSGGKDSTFAIQRAMEKGWNIKYLISVKPTRKDCYLFHYATVEHTKELAKILGIPHIYLKCNIAEPKKEAEIIKNAIKQNKIDAVVLGGTGLQETQLRSIQNALMPLGVESFASNAGEEHDLITGQMLNNGYEIMITQVASDGLIQWLGKRISKSNFNEFKEDSVKYGFHIGGEGGYFDTLVTDTLFFKKKLLIGGYKTIIEDNYCGYVEITKFKIVDKCVGRDFRSSKIRTPATFSFASPSGRQRKA